MSAYGNDPCMTPVKAAKEAIESFMSKIHDEFLHERNEHRIAEGLLKKRIAELETENEKLKERLKNETPKS